MTDPSSIGYGFGAAIFAVLAILLLTGWRGRLPGALLIVAVGSSTLWSGLLAYGAAAATIEWPRWIPAMEVVRAGTWWLFLMGVLHGVSRRLLSSRSIWIGLALLAAALLLVVASPDDFPLRLDTDLVYSPVFVGLLVLPLGGLILIEQVWRNARPEGRWAVKFLCLSLLAIFAYDLLLWGHAFLAGTLDLTLWTARGMVNALVAPLIAISAARSNSWSTEIFVSRHVVFYTGSLILFGAVLGLTAIGGYYIRAYGGTWGGFAQVVLLFGTLVVLCTLALSTELRARLRVFLAKHFYSNRYDYRKEWLELTSILAENDTANLGERVLLGIQRIVDSTDSALWMMEDGQYVCQAARSMRFPEQNLDPEDPLIRFLADSDWVVNLDELRSKPELYHELSAPEWLVAVDDPWLVVPLRQQDNLLGFVVLGQSLAPRELNWEDWDLLRVAGREAASYLALKAASEELARARQFEAFNRLSAYVVHDLKNLVAQLGLVVSNARRHKDNPVFMVDAIQTVDHAVARMNRLLGQLRKDRFVAQEFDIVGLNRVVHEVVEERRSDSPSPSLQECDEGLQVLGDRDRLAAMLEHLIQNAQEATPPEGDVLVRIWRDGVWGVLEVQDSGTGMDERFVRNRLFEPFATTKGNAGLGMGVYQVRETVRLMGGRVDVQSRPGSGTTFKVCLPLHDTGTRAMTA
jgi:putative PEP-CTERM system histidine kinase